MRLLTALLFIVLTSCGTIRKHQQGQPAVNAVDVSLTIDVTEEGIITRAKRSNMLSIEIELEEVLKHYREMFESLHRENDFYEITGIRKKTKI